MSAFPDTPQSLIARIAARTTGENESDWVRFFEIYQPVIRKFAAFSGAKNDSEDVAQEILVKLVSVFQSGAYRPEKGRFRSYLASMIRREVINRWYKDQARLSDKHVSLDLSENPPIVTVPSETEAVLDMKWRLALRAAAQEHVLAHTALAARSKEIYRAYVMEEVPIEEVAARFGVSRNQVSQVKTRVERMVSDFERLLED